MVCGKAARKALRFIRNSSSPVSYTHLDVYKRQALDQGTTSSRAILFDENQNIVSSAQKELTQYYPQSGWVEHDPMEIYSTVWAVMMEVITRADIDTVSYTHLSML